MDLNYILCWFTGMSCAAGLYFQLSQRRRSHDWLAAYLLVSVTLTGGLAVLPRLAGYAATALWLPLIALPMVGYRWVTKLASRNQLEAAHALSLVLAVAHPADGWRRQPMLLRALILIRDGDRDGATRLLEASGKSPDAAARFTTLQSLRVEARWAELVAHIDGGNPSTVPRDENTLLLLARALGETDQVERMLWLIDRNGWQQLSAAARPMMTLFTVAFTGRTELIQRLFRGPLADLSTAQRDYWLATAQQAAGSPESASALLRRVLDGRDASLSASARRRLATPLPSLDPSRLDRHTRDELFHLESGLRHQMRFGAIGTQLRGPARVTLALMLINIVVFLIEPGGAEDPQRLIPMGALVIPTEFVSHPFLRTLSAGFLHFGWIHVTVNMFGLWLLGRYVERVWGRLSVAVCFLGASVGANLIAIAIAPASIHDPVVMAGASSGVMGLLGAAIAFVAVEWYRRRLPLLGRQLRIFVSVFVLQMAFDLMTPVVSSTLHVAGFVLGLVLGGLLACQRPDDRELTVAAAWPDPRAHG